MGGVVASIVIPCIYKELYAFSVTWSVLVHVALEAILGSFSIASTNYYQVEKHKGNKLIRYSNFKERVPWE